MKLIISGTPGSGKSTIARMLSSYFNIPRFCGGDMRREIAREMKMTLGQFNRLAEKEDWTDKKIDKKLIEVVKKNRNFIIESRTLPYLIKNNKDIRDIKKIKSIFIDADIEVRAERIFNLKRKEETFKNIKETVKGIKKREKSDSMRYEKIYGINLNDKSVYDVVIDTTHKNAEESFKEILQRLKQKI